MEILLPLGILGGACFYSNLTKKESVSQKSNGEKSKNENQKDSFSNMGAEKGYLPNVNSPIQNYPVTNIDELTDNVNHYPNPNQATDTYLNQNLYEKKEIMHEPITNNIQDIYSISGNYLSSEQFKHNNMVPFYGGKIKGQLYNDNMAESILDNMVGSGQQVIKKIEQAPLFKPEENISWTHQMPNQSDFYQSRVVPGMKNANVKPFDSMNVGPGLDQGYSLSGSGGFNSGMEARDKWLPKTIDELRVDTNPRLEYELGGHEGPAISNIKNASTLENIGRVEKQRPDTYFINSQDRWLTTVGDEKAPMLRSIQDAGIIRKNDGNVDYSGPAGSGDKQGTYVSSNFEPAKKHQLGPTNVNPSVGKTQGPADSYIKSHTNYVNNRSTVEQPSFRSIFSGAVGAVVAPIMDIVRPTRKEEFINNTKIYGASSSIPKGYAVEPVSAPTTIKETTMHSVNFNINNQKEGIYVNNYSSPDLTLRNTTNSEYFNNASSNYGNTDYSSAYVQHNNEIKSQTIYNRPNLGGMQIFNPSVKMSCAKGDCNSFDGRMNPAYSKISALPPSSNNYGALTSNKLQNENIGYDRINPNILDAFKNNPYTHSLTNSV